MPPIGGTAGRKISLRHEPLRPDNLGEAEAVLVTHHMSRKLLWPEDKKVIILHQRYPDPGERDYDPNVWTVVKPRRPNPETERRRSQIKLFYGREVKPSMRTTLDELTCLCRRLGIKRVATVPFGLEHEGLELADWQAEAGVELHLTFYCEKLGDYVSLGGTPPPRVLTRRFGVGHGLRRRDPGAPGLAGQVNPAPAAG